MGPERKFEIVCTVFVNDCAVLVPKVILDTCRLANRPKNIALITEYLQCIAYKPNGRSKALTKCDEFLKTHSEDLSFEELKKLAGVAF